MTPEPKRAAASLVFDLSGERVLVVWNKTYRGWCLPGGKVEPGEDLVTAQARELREETSLISTRVSPVYTAPSCVEPDRKVTVFAVHQHTGKATAMEDGCAVDWMRPEQLAATQPFSPFYAAMFAKVFPDRFPPPKVPGLKHDGADGRHERKPRWTLLPLDAVREVVRVLTKGAEKYTAGGWEHVDNARERYSDALLRHAAAYAEGEERDPEWGLHTLAHATCCALFLIAIDLRRCAREKEPPGKSDEAGR